MDFIQQLLAEKEKHLSRIRAINQVLESYGYEIEDAIGKTTVDANKKGRRFPKGGTYLEQIEYVLEHENRFLHTQEIASIIAEKDNVTDIKWFRRRVSASLSKFKADQDIEGLINYQFGKQTRDNVWGFKEWLDAQGNIKPQYAYKEKSTLESA